MLQLPELREQRGVKARRSEGHHQQGKRRKRDLTDDENPRSTPCKVDIDKIDETYAERRGCCRCRAADGRPTGRKRRPQV